LPKKLKIVTLFVIAGIGFLFLLYRLASSPNWNNLPTEKALQEFSGEYYMASFWSWHLSIKSDKTFSLEIFTDTGSHLQYTGDVSVEGNRFQIIMSDSNSNKPSELVPIRWGQRKYIIDVDTVSDFCNDIEQGWEPRDDMIGGPYYLRDGDWDRFVIWRPIQLDGHLLCP
jgi:hypothetical protein